MANYLDYKQEFAANRVAELVLKICRLYQYAEEEGLVSKTPENKATKMALEYCRIVLENTNNLMMAIRIGFEVMDLAIGEKFSYFYNCLISADENIEDLLKDLDNYIDAVLIYFKDWKDSEDYFLVSALKMTLDLAFPELRNYRNLN